MIDPLGVPAGLTGSARLELARPAAQDAGTLLFNELLRRAGIHMGGVTDRVDESQAWGSWPSASHGCTRSPIPYSVFIYDWIEVGHMIYVYD